MTLWLHVIGTIVTVDRIEGPYAVVEWRDATFTEVPIAALPSGTTEGARLLLRASTLPPPAATHRSGRSPR